MSAVRRNYLENDKVNLRNLRHDLVSAIDVAEMMVELSEKRPEKRNEYDVLLKEAVTRLREIAASLHGNGQESPLENGSFAEIIRE